jgi:hypothetical protein
MGKPVFALDFPGNAPAGNEILFEKGAKPIGSRGELARLAAAILETGAGQGAGQLSFRFSAGEPPGRRARSPPAEPSEPVP